MPGFDHSAGDAEESVGDASEGSGVFMSAASQRMIFRPAGFVALDGGHGPVVGGVPEPSVRGESALDQDGPSRPFGDGRDAEVASQGLQFGFPDAVEGFGEDDGQDGGSDAGDGAQDVDGLSAFHGPDAVDGPADFGPDLLDFGVEGFEPPDDPSGGFGDGLGGSRRGRDGLVAKRGQDVFGGGPGAAFPEHGFDGGQAHAAGLPRRRGEGPEIEGPSPAEVRRGLEESGVVAPDLRLELIDQAGSFFDQVAVRARQLAQPDDLRRRRLHLPERLPVGGERTGQDEGVPAVVLGSGRREPVAEAVELLGVEREHGDAALQQGVHLRAVRLLDGGGGPAFGAVPEDPVGHPGQAVAAVGEGAFAEELAVRVDDGDLVGSGRPVDARVYFELRHCIPPL